MNIQSTRQAPQPISPPANTSVPQSQTPTPSLKPLAEEWVVGEKTYSDTASLLADQQELENAAVTYKFRTQDKAEAYSQKEKLMNATGNALLGAAGGAATGAVVATAFGVLGAIGDIASAFMGGSMSGSSVNMLAPIVLCAGGGAAVGAYMGYQATPAESNGQVQGLLTKGSQGAFFYPNGKVEAKVDLGQFAKSAVPAVTPEIKAESQPLKNAALGAAAGLVAVPGALIPLVGFFGPSAVGYDIGSKLDRRTSLGSGLGLAAGVGVTAATVATLSRSGFGMPALALAGGLALGGALLGDKIITKMNTTPAQRNYGDQWWSRHQVAQDSPS